MIFQHDPNARKHAQFQKEGTVGMLSRHYVHEGCPFRGRSTTLLAHVPQPFPKPKPLSSLQGLTGSAGRSSSKSKLSQKLPHWNTTCWAAVKGLRLSHHTTGM